jgi:hypothetical protein
MCCHHRWPKEANILHEILTASGKDSNINFNDSFFVKRLFLRKIIKKKETTAIAES